MKYLNGLLYIVILGLLCFPLGRLLAMHRFRYNTFPFSPFKFERGGVFYEKLKIRSWQGRVPDVSRWFPFLVPKKALNSLPDTGKLELMINETCVAELTHFILCILGIALPFIMPGIIGICVFLIYVLIGNIPFILIQRFNRPRLVTVLERRRRKDESTFTQFK